MLVVLRFQILTDPELGLTKGNQLKLLRPGLREATEHKRYLRLDLRLVTNLAAPRWLKICSFIIESLLTEVRTQKNRLAIRRMSTATGKESVA
jgi:hypothetical protein